MCLSLFQGMYNAQEFLMKPPSCSAQSLLNQSIFVIKPLDVLCGSILLFCMKIHNVYKFLVSNKEAWQRKCCQALYSHEACSSLTIHIIILGISSVVFANDHFTYVSTEPLQNPSQQREKWRKIERKHIL